MPRRARTAKALAQRIDLEYFKHLHPFRRWKFLLSVALPALAVVWVVGTTLTDHQKPYTAGPMSPAHAFIGKRCELCHATTAGFFRKHVQDEACKSCHDGPVHQAGQTFTPSCASCHTEHRGAVQLADVSDKLCTQCHADLHTRDGHARFQTRVTAFSTGHPEFAPVREHRDPGTVKLDHEVHLKAGLKGPHGPVQMVCGDCHRTPANSAPLPYAMRSVQPVAGPADPLAPQPTRAYMTPVNYEKHCAACHLLTFDRRFSEPVPHKEPKVVHEFVVKKLTEYIAAHPEDVHKVEVPVQRIPEVKIETRPARDAADWVAMRTSEAEQLLWKKTCKECHTVKFGAGPLPEIPKAQITVRWLPHSVFSHDAHRMLDCASCHAQAPKSKETADVLLPGIANCRQCHVSSQLLPADSAQGRCFECHKYHDWSKERPIDGRYTIPKLLKGM